MLQQLRVDAVPILDETPCDAALHLQCGLAGEGERQNALGTHVFLHDKSEKAPRKHCGLTASGSGGNDAVFIGVHYGPLLFTERIFQRFN